MFRLSEIATKIGLDSSSLKTLATTSIEDGSSAFDFSNARLLRLGHYPYWNIWSNTTTKKCAAEWKVQSGIVGCFLKKPVAFSDFGDDYNHNAQPPQFEFPDRLYYRSTASFSGSYYGTDFKLPEGLTHYRVGLNAIQGSQSGIGSIQEVPTNGTISDYSTTVQVANPGDYYFSVHYQYNEEATSIYYELPQLRSNVQLYKLSAMGDVTSTLEIIYNSTFTAIKGFSGTIVVNSTAEANTIQYRFSYAQYIGGVLTAVSGLGAPLQEVSFVAGELNKYRLVEYNLPNEIPLADIPIENLVIIDLLSASAPSATQFIEIPANIDR